MSARDFSYASSQRFSYLENHLVRFIENISGKYPLYKIYKQWYDEHHITGEPYYDAAIRLFDIQLQYDKAILQHIPQHNPLIVVGNHPHGVLDGVISAHLINKIRNDFKIIVTMSLYNIKGSADTMLPLDFDISSPQAKLTNINTQRQAYKALKNGGAIIIYPAGDVSTIPSWKDKIAIDSQWHSFTARLISKTQATVLPIFIDGQNSMMFQLLSFVIPDLRSSLYMREIHRAMGKQIRVNIGKPIPYADLQAYENNQDMLTYLRQKTYALKDGL